MAMRRSISYRLILSALLLAAVCAAGTVQAGEIILYDGRNFSGRAVTLTQSWPNLGDFDNKASSVRVISGTWKLYRNANYGVTSSRPSLTLTPGEYPNLRHVGFPRNRLSSVRLIAGQGQPPPPPAISEDCIQLNWQNVQARAQGGGNWSVTDGNSYLLDFGTNQAGAVRSKNVIRHYRMNKQCFVGRQNMTMRYWLVNNQAPSGGMQGEDCIRFALAQTQVRQVQGQWKIVDGGRSIAAFGNNRSQAENAHAIMNAHGFNRICFVGRPNPPMIYFRR